MVVQSLPPYYTNPLSCATLNTRSCTVQHGQARHASNLLKLADNGIICFPHSVISFITVCIIIGVERIIIVILATENMTIKLPMQSYLSHILYTRACPFSQEHHDMYACRDTDRQRYAAGYITRLDLPQHPGHPPRCTRVERHRQGHTQCNKHGWEMHTYLTI